MRVAVIEPIGEHGGMDYYDSELCQGLAKAGVLSTLYTSRMSQEPLGFSTRFPYRDVFSPGQPLWKRACRHLRATWTSVRSAARAGASVAHFHWFHFGPLEVFQALAARWHGCRVVATVHDVEPLAESVGGSTNWVRSILFWGADRLIVHNETSRRTLHRAKGVDVIPHGHFLSQVPEAPTAAEARVRLGLPPEGRIVLFFGQIKEAKGLDLLLEAAAQARNEGVDLHLVIAGRPWKQDFGHYAERIRTLALEDCCTTHIRYIANEDVGDYFAAADVAVFPYRKIFQSGALLMAMSHGTPVIASDLDSFRELIEDGRTGFLFPSEEVPGLATALKEALHRDDLPEVGRRGRRWIRQHLDWEAIGRRTRDAYRRAVAG